MTRVLILVACLAAVLAGPPGSGAAVLERSEPASGGSLPAGAPVVLEFSEPISIAPDGLALVDTAGNVLPVGPPEAVSDRIVRIPLGEAGSGLRALTWTATTPGSEEPVRGSITFDVGGTTTGALDVAGIARAAEAATLAVTLLITALVALIVVVVVGLVQHRRRGTGSPGIAAIGIGAAAAVAVGAVLGILAAVGTPDATALFAAACAVAIGAAVLGLAALRPSGAPRTAALATVLALILSAVALAGVATAEHPDSVAADAQKQVLLGQGGQVSLTITPSAVGANTATIGLRDVEITPDDEPVLILRPLDGRIGAMRVPLVAADDGSYVADRVLLPFAGRWRSQLEGIGSITPEDPAVLDFDVIPNQEVHGGPGS